jgi:hypothetical protein
MDRRRGDDNRPYVLARTVRGGRPQLKEYDHLLGGLDKVSEGLFLLYSLGKRGSENGKVSSLASVMSANQAYGSSSHKEALL